MTARSLRSPSTGYTVAARKAAPGGAETPVEGLNTRSANLLMPNPDSMSPKAGTSAVDWDRLLARLLHPTQAAVLGAMDHIAVPLSPVMLARVFERTISLSSLSYHVGCLAKMEVLTLTETRPRRGATEHLYSLTGVR